MGLLITQEVRRKKDQSQVSDGLITNYMNMKQ